MWNRDPNVALRDILLIDAAACVAMGILLIAGTAHIETLTAIPSVVLHWAGLVLFPVAAFMTLVATRLRTVAIAVQVVIAGNALWVLGSLLLVSGLWFSPNLLGQVFIAVQAVAVVVLCAVEAIALRRITATVAA